MLKPVKKHRNNKNSINKNGIPAQMARSSLHPGHLVTGKAPELQREKIDVPDLGSIARICQKWVGPQPTPDKPGWAGWEIKIGQVIDQS